MRSIPLMAVSTVVLAAAWGCGSSGGNVQPNTPPVANFTAPACTATVACQFTDASTDADGTIASQSWDFGDGSPLGTGATPTHIFATPNTYQVKLTVTDNNGDTNAKTVPVVVTTGTPTNVPPVASFTAPTTCTANAACTFTSTSTDADGTIATAHWDFGDQTVGDGLSVDHTYAAAGTFNVTLTVTDNAGGTNAVTQAVTVGAPAAQDCTASGGTVVCTLNITSKSTISVTMTDHSCQLTGNNITVEQPRTQTLFFNSCNQTLGTNKVITDATGAPAKFDAGTQLRITFVQGRPGPNDPPVGFPAGKLSNSFPNWTLTFEDGGNPRGTGEPDFNDVVLAVQATPAQ
jgi:PKD repeat protein